MKHVHNCLVGMGKVPLQIGFLNSIINLQFSSQKFQFTALEWLPKMVSLFQWPPLESSKTLITNGSFTAPFCIFHQQWLFPLTQQMLISWTKKFQNISTLYAKNITFRPFKPLNVIFWMEGASNSYCWVTKIQSWKGET